MRLIDADAVVTIHTYDDMYEEWGSETMTVAEAMDKWSDEGCPPTVDAEPVRHGEWIHDINNLYGCSKCFNRETMSLKRLKPYCPNCEAKMDGGKQDA